MSQSQIKTFLITGVSTGLGRAFAEVALREGHRVVGTVRNEDAAKSFEALAPNFHAVGICQSGVPAYAAVAPFPLSSCLATLPYRERSTLPPPALRTCFRPSL